MSPELGEEWKRNVDGEGERLESSQDVANYNSQVEADPWGGYASQAGSGDDFEFAEFADELDEEEKQEYRDEQARTQREMEVRIGSHLSTIYIYHIIHIMLTSSCT